eukprot:CCRYP_013523-RA/>CCRYP_013523-RA protein AED:0.11 eAED:0.11 QI:0/-1/0/1/-1/1/1/0/427
MSYQFTTTTSHSDETYLESFLESLIGSSFPNEIRRTLEHLKYLNRVGEATLEEWRDRQDDCLMEVKKGVVGLRQNWMSGEGSENGGRKRKREEGDAGAATSQGHATTKSDSTMSSGDRDSEHQFETDPSALNNRDQFPPIPTNQEILTYLHKNHPDIFTQHNQIAILHDQLQQLSAERIQTAHQLRGMVDMALGRLNRDLERFEKELGIVSSDAGGELGSGVVASAVPSLVGRASSVPGVAMDKSNQGLGNEKTNIRSAANNNNIRRASAAATSTTSSTSAPHLSQLSRSNSCVLPPSTSAGALHQRPKDLAAIQVLPNTSEWILAKIISYDKSSKIYTVSDEDVESDKVYHIPASRVVALNKTSNYTRGDTVYAVYPDTTSFYLATVSSTKNNFVMVHFRDDGDEHGITHEKAVPIWLVMRVPGKG